MQTPAKEVQVLRGELQSWVDKTITPGSNLLAGVCGKTLEIEAEFEVTPGAASFAFKVPRGGSNQTVIGYRFAEKKMFVTRSGRSDIKNFDRTDEEPLPPQNGCVKLHIFLDSSSVEVFGNDGAAVITDDILPDPLCDGIELFAEGGSVRLIALKAWPLQSIWHQP